MDDLKLLCIGTPVIDRFARAGPDVLKRWELSEHSSNFMDIQRLEALERSLGDGIFLTEAGDNARNVADAFARLERIQMKSGKGEWAGVPAEAREPVMMRAAGAISPMRGGAVSQPPAGFEVAYAGSVGADAGGELVARSLESAGVQSLLCTAGGRTGEIACLIAPDGSRTFAVSLGVATEYPMDVPLPDADMLFATSITALGGGSLAQVLEREMTHCARAGIPIAISLESVAMLATMKENAIALAQRADYLFLNEDEMAALGLNEKQTAELAMTVFIKRGGKGSTVFEEGRRVSDIPVTAVALVQDTTGAGDAYAAGVLWGLAHGMGATAAAHIGSKTGAAVVEKFGASLPDDFALE